MNATTTRAEGRDLFLTRLIDATPEAVYRAWVEAPLLEQWFCPQPWTARVVENDVRAGGTSQIVMIDPQGQEFPTQGTYLEVVPNRKLVFTDAFTSAWEPSGKPFMVAEVTFTDEDGKTRYAARVRHWSVEDREQHEQMGFHDGWTKVAEQLAQLVEHG